MNENVQGEKVQSVVLRFLEGRTYLRIAAKRLSAFQKISFEQAQIRLISYWAAAKEGLGAQTAEGIYHFLKTQLPGGPRDDNAWLKAFTAGVH